MRPVAVQSILEQHCSPGVRRIVAAAARLAEAEQEEQSRKGKGGGGGILITSAHLALAALAEHDGDVDCAAALGVLHHSQAGLSRRRCAEVLAERAAQERRWREEETRQYEDSGSSSGTSIFSAPALHFVFQSYRWAVFKGCDKVQPCHLLWALAADPRLSYSPLRTDPLDGRVAAAEVREPPLVWLLQQCSETLPRPAAVYEQALLAVTDLPADVPWLPTLAAELADAAAAHADPEDMAALKTVRETRPVSGDTARIAVCVALQTDTGLAARWRADLDSSSIHASLRTQRRVAEAYAAAGCGVPEGWLQQLASYGELGGGSSKGAAEALQVVLRAAASGSGAPALASCSGGNANTSSTSSGTATSQMKVLCQLAKLLERNTAAGWLSPQATQAVLGHLQTLAGAAAGRGGINSLAASCGPATAILALAATRPGTPAALDPELLSALSDMADIELPCMVGGEQQQQLAALMNWHTHKQHY
eukprot:XP_001693859.1 predicted protein [Chlamydomonas reinhardtii]